MSILVAGTVAFDTVGSLARLPGRDETARLDAVAEAPGGAAGNVALGLARLGERPRLVAVVGRDFGGSAYERLLDSGGVDLSGLARRGGLTARAFMFSDPDGSQHIYFYPGDYARPGDLRAAPAALGHFAAGPIDLYPALMEAADVVTFDPGQEVFHRDVAEILACLPRVDYLLLNEHELARLASRSGLGVGGLLAAGPRAIVETRGAAGARLHRAEARPLDVPAVPARLVDPTGAGDAHRAGFLLALARGAGLEAATRVAAVVASFAVEAHGPQRGLPSREAAEKRHRERFGDWPL